MKEGLPQIPASEEPLPDWREVDDPFWQKVTAFMKLDALLGQLDEVIVYDNAQVQQWLDEQDLAAFYTPEVIQREYQYRKLAHLVDEAFECRIPACPREAPKDPRRAIQPIQRNDNSR
jgi:hypothetical protein